MPHRPFELALLARVYSTRPMLNGILPFVYIAVPSDTACIGVSGLAVTRGAGCCQGVFDYFAPIPRATMGDSNLNF